MSCGHCWLRERGHRLAGQPGRAGSSAPADGASEERHALGPWRSGVPASCAARRVFQHEQGRQAAQGPQGSLSLCPSPDLGEEGGLLPSQSFCSPHSQYCSPPHPEETVQGRWGPHLQSPQGSDPLPPGLSSPLLPGGECGAPILDLWEGATLVLSPTRWSCRPVEWGWVGAWRSSSDTVPTTHWARLPLLPQRDTSQPCLSTRGPGRLCLGRDCHSAARRCG